MTLGRPWVTSPSSLGCLAIAILAYVARTDDLNLTNLPYRTLTNASN